MSKSEHAYLIPVFILVGFIAFLFTNCDTAKFPQRPPIAAPKQEVPTLAQPPSQAPTQTIDSELPIAPEPPPPETNSFELPEPPN